MECPEKWDSHRDKSVYDLVTRLCEKIASPNKINDGSTYKIRPLVKKMRAKAFEILLRKSEKSVPRESCEPAMDLLSFYFDSNLKKSNIGDYKDMILLKQNIDWVIDGKVEETVPCIDEILTCVIGLKNSVCDDGGKFMFENPFSFGNLDKMLPVIALVGKNEPKPYQHFPNEIFQLPFAISDCGNNMKNDESTLYPYLIESFVSVPGTNLLHFNNFGTTRSNSSDSNIIQNSKQSSLAYTNMLNSVEGFLSFPRLLEPRDLCIPNDENKDQESMKTFDCSSRWESAQCADNVNSSGPSATLWELVNMDINLQPDIWEEASKLPPVEKRGFISSSITQMSHWKKTYRDKMDKLHVISETQFILHLKYLTIGIASSSFYFDKHAKKFIIKQNLCLEGLHMSTLQMYCVEILKIGTCYWKLNDLVTRTSSDGGLLKEGFVYKSMCNNIRQYLVWFRLEVDKVFGEGLVTIEQEGKRLPTLLEIVHNLKPLSIQIQTMAKVYKVYECDMNEYHIGGAGLMAHLYNEITMITQTSVAAVLYATLQATCQVYFSFIQRFIFEGELEDHFEEFFIKKDNQFINSFNKQYWNKGFVIRSNETVPQFLKGVAKYILLCGKSMRLLKLCNPDDPLCVMLSTDYPQIKCCFTFDEIEDQQNLYDQYRTQCLYVCGEPVTFQNLLIQKEAEKRAFREMVITKQTETMEKLIEERKRLSRMLLVNKRKQFSALREAAENAVALRNQERDKNIQKEKLLLEHFKASDKLHQLRIEEEKKKVVAFYSEIERAVNKRKMMADWKIKRLQLDVRRVQLLTSEKVNLSRECMEMKHKDEKIPDYEDDHDIISNAPIELSTDESNTVTPISEIKNSLDSPLDFPKIESADLADINFNPLPKNLSNLSSITSNLSNDNKLSDINSNVSSITEKSNVLTELSPSDILNSNILLIEEKSNNNITNSFQNQRLEALKNKQKVMSHEFGMRIDSSSSILTKDEDILSVINNNVSEAQRNKTKVLGSNINKSNAVSHPVDSPQFNTYASREALKNKRKVLGHEFGMDIESKPVLTKQRDNLKLDLQNCNKPLRTNNSQILNSVITPGSIANTPNDFNERLDIETPSTFDIGPFGLPSAATLSPTSAQVIDVSYEDANITKTGFRFPNIIEEHASDDDVPDFPIVSKTSDETVNKEIYDKFPYYVKSSVWSFSDDNLNFDNFKPFGINSASTESLKLFDLFEKPIVYEPFCTPYPDIREIIKDIENNSAAQMLKLASLEDNNDNLLQKIEDVDFSTISTCLQRSIIIPLSYQLEMVNNATLKYFLVNCDLYDHMKNICNYFFLMDGEFAKTICTNIFEKLNTTNSPQELLNFATLHSILDKSFGSSISGVNKYAENLSFIVSDMPTSFHHSSPDVLECLTLSYAVSWPLNIIFSQEAMERYAKIFQFLLKMRRISWALECDSEVLKMSLKEEFMVSKELLCSPQYHSVQLYRYMMSSLIRALHSYISTTCLQSSWKELEKDLISAQTLDDLYSIHVIYVKKVLFRCLLNNRSSPIMELLNDIFKVILEFHHYLNARCWHIAENEIYYTHPLFAKIRESFLIFDKLSKRLHKRLTRLTECGYQPHLAELLSVMNMNDYYNKADNAK